MTRPAILHLGEVSGVAERLSSALNESGAWKSSHELLLPNLKPGDPITKRRANSPLKARQVNKRASHQIEKHRPDVVHVHWARLAPFIPKTESPRIIHAHGSDVRQTSGPFSKLVFQKMKQFDFQIASTPDLLEFMPSTSTWLPNPVDTNFFRNESDPPGEPFLFIFARFMHVKGASILLDASRQVRRRFPNLKIVGVSGGEFDDEARNAGVQLVPFVDQIGIRNLLQKSSLVVGQQKLGILSLAELEAMSMQRPLFTLLSPDLYSGRFSSLISYSPSELGGLIIDFFSDLKDCETTLDDLRQDVVDLHSYHSVVENLSNIYQQA